MNVRELVYKSLFSIEKSGKYSNLELNSVIDENGLDGKDKGLYTALLYGVTERKTTLDYFIEFYTKKSIKRLDLAVAVLLRMGIYQIIYMDKIPDSAAVNETVKLAQHYASRAKGFINGVLRSVCRDKDELPYSDKLKDPIKWQSVYFGIPTEICQSLSTDYPDMAEDIMSAFSEPTSVTLRVNTLKTDKASLMGEYPDLLEECRYSDSAVRMVGSYPLSEFKPLHDGRCYVQDEASQIAGLVLDPHEGDKIIDVCAAPGGKSFYAAIQSNDTGSVISMDVHESKLSLISSGAARLSINNISVLQNDSQNALPELIGTADRVICDVPCSGLGVIAKKSDLRNNFTASNELPKLQLRILSASASYLKVGGTLVYSTCTLRKAENEDVVMRFLSDHQDFELIPFTLTSLNASGGMLTLFPHIHHTDGFFVAKLRRLR